MCGAPVCATVWSVHSRGCSPPNSTLPSQNCSQEPAQSIRNLKVAATLSPIPYLQGISLGRRNLTPLPPFPIKEGGVRRAAPLSSQERGRGRG
ncbi:MAG: hypothetical protein KatS3mg022_1537 [Armatimonadota bacterium]|nr:MAG: hypothetical protein KatS3mg022_1537 [Armatimonadota bacterium]